MKKLSNLKEAQKLNKEEQKAILGGKTHAIPAWCRRFYISDPEGITCINGNGVPGTIVYYGGLDYCC